MLGRFLSPDTIVPQPGDPQSFNRYAYTLNNPLKYTDPSGHMPAEPEDWGVKWVTHSIPDTEFGKLLARAHYYTAKVLFGGGGIWNEEGGNYTLTWYKPEVDPANRVMRNIIFVPGAAGSAGEAQAYLRAANKAATNPKVWELDLIRDAGSGLSTNASPPATASDIFSTKVFEGKDRVVAVPADAALPPGTQWVQTPGTTRNPLLDANHWELRVSEWYSQLPWNEYAAEWNARIAPLLARLAQGWETIRRK